jgi:DHA2 family multidrug resistance protein
VLTVYTMASMVAVVLAVLLIRYLSVGRYMFISAAAFGVTALACAMGPAPDVMIALRVVQGFASGGFGPIAFVSVFMVAGPGGVRLPALITVLAFVLLAPVALGPVVAGFVEARYGWQALFLLQALIGVVLAAASRLFVPCNPPDRSALQTDWVAVVLLAIAVASLVLILSQGTRRFWFESDLITWTLALCLGATAGFVLLARVSPTPIIAPRLLLTDRFGPAIAINLLFRVAVVVPVYLLPQFLLVVQGYRPLDVARLMLWAVVPQFIALPLAWRLMHVVELRAVMVLGLLLCAIATALAIDVTGLVAADELRPTLVLFAVGEVLFLAPALVVGTSRLQLPDLPTASFLFNATTLGGTTLGVGLVSQLATLREHFHSSILTAHVSPYDGFLVDRVTRTADALARGLTDDGRVTAQAVALVAGAARRQAWVLAFGDAFMVVAALLVVSGMAVAAIGRVPALADAGAGTRDAR